MVYMLMTLTLDGTAKFFVSIGLPARDKLGCREVASSRRAEQERDCLRGFGADEITTMRAFWAGSHRLSAGAVVRPLAGD